MIKRKMPFRGAESAHQQRRRQQRAHHHMRCLRRLGVVVTVVASPASFRTEPSSP
jgi:hypothetical protein